MQPFFLKWAQLDLNQRPPDYESGATNQLSYRPQSKAKNYLCFRVAKIQSFFNYQTV